METKQKNYILDNLDKLAELTDINSLFLSYLESKSVLEKSGSKLLESIKNRKRKSKTFYQIIVKKKNSYNVLCDALKKTNQSGALKILMRLKPVRFDVHNPVHLFTGRKAQLQRLHKQMIYGESTTTLVTQKASVTGLGGIGKTELCRKYIQNYSDYYDNNIIWIGAENSNIMTRSFRTLAKDYLEISLKDADGDDKDMKSIVDEVYNYFHDRKCLFVFDNAVNSNDPHLNTFMPERVQNPPHILITSRDKDWELPFNTLELDELTESEAMEFVKKGLQITDNNHDVIISELVNRLQRFPLAIQQAISFIKQQITDGKTYEIREYLVSFEAKSKLLLDFEISPFLSNKYSKTTFTTWKMTTDMISKDVKDGKFAMFILNIIAYFQADEIPSSLFEFHEDIVDEIHSSLQLLVKYSMINCHPGEGLMNVHRLVQQVTRIELNSKNEEETILYLGLKMFPRDKVNLKSVEHAKSIYEYASHYNDLVKTFHQLPADIVNEVNNSSRYKNSYELGGKYVKLLQKHLSPSHASCIDLEYMLARAIYHERKANQEKYDDCLPLFHKLFNLYINHGHYLVKQFDVLQCASFVADILEHQGRYKRAVALSIPVIRLQKEVFGFHSKETLETVFTPFVVFLKTHKYKKAIGWCRKFLNLYKKAGYKVHFPDDDKTRTLTSSFLSKKTGLGTNLKEVYLCDITLHLTELLKISVSWQQMSWEVVDLFIEKDRFKYALNLANKIYESNKKFEGPDNEHTLYALHWIAKCKKLMGNPKGAYDILKDLKPKYTKALSKSPELMQHVKDGVTMDLMQIGVFCKENE